MAGNAYLVDTNILIRWVQPLDPGYGITRNALGRLVHLGARLHYTSQNLGEFWNSLTRPADRNGYGLSPAEANDLAGEIEAEFSPIFDGALVHREWRRMLVDYGISGVRVHDARLVAAMRVHGVKHILTLNVRDFQRFEDIEAVSPQEVVSEA